MAPPRARMTNDRSTGVAVRVKLAVSAQVRLLGNKPPDPAYNEVKTTGLADREENHVTELSSRGALHASTAGPPGCHCRPML